MPAVKFIKQVDLVHALPQVTAGIKDEVEKSHRALDSIVSLTPFWGFP